MKKSSRLLLILSFLFAILASGALYMYLTTLKQPVADAPELIEVIVAKEDIPARTMVTVEMLETKQVLPDSIFSEYIKSTEELVGFYLKVDVYAGNMFQTNDVIKGESTDLSMLLSGSERAVTVNVDGQSGISKMVRVGDRVDVVVYLPQIMEQSRIVRPDVVKMILQNVKVVAINQSLISKSGGLGSETTNEADSIPPFFVTLAVPVMDVEMFILAKDIGIVDLTLRPHEGDYLVVTEGVIWQDLLLNDFGQIKDLFPQYDIIGQKQTALAPENYKYEQYVYYTVQYGDTLQKISTKFYGDASNFELIKTVNKITDEDLIISGTGLKIPLLEGRGDEGENN